MKNLLIGFAVLCFSLPALAYRHSSPDHPVHVHGYDKKDGTHVDSYYRSKPHQHDNDGYRKEDHTGE